MKLSQIIIYTFLSAATLGTATADVPPEVTKALEQTGANRQGLELLLKRYRKSPEKLKAAYFLLTNMAQHHTDGEVRNIDPQLPELEKQILNVYSSIIQDTRPDGRSSKVLNDSLKAAQKEMRTRVQAMTFTPPVYTQNRKNDLALADSAFIAGQVDRAFALRRSSPLVQRLSFNEFLEYILPYRSISNYPLAYPSSAFAGLYSQFLSTNGCDSLEAIAARYNHLMSNARLFAGKYPFKERTGLHELFFTGLHDCVDIAYYGANILRASGVPALVGYNSCNRYFRSNHFFVAAFNKDGQPCTFNPESSLPVYRYQFDQSLNLFYFYFSPRPNNPADLAAPGEPIPDNLSDPCIEDHTEWSTNVCTLTLPYTAPEKRTLAYLASFNSQTGLTAVTWGRVDAAHKRVTFEKVVPNNLYFPVICCDDRQLKAFGNPFLFTADSLHPQGQMTKTFTADNACTVSTLLKRKFPVKKNMLRLAMQSVGMCLIASDDYHFRQGVDTLWRCVSTPLNDWQDVPLSGRRPYKHYRIIPPAGDPHVRISEIEYLVDPSLGYRNVTYPRPLVPSANRQSEPTKQWMRLLPEPLDKLRKYKISDGDITTAPEASQHTTIHLKEPQTINRLRFCIKNAGNGIVFGNAYQLFEWRNGRWSRLWTRMAVDGQWKADNLQCGRLYWLHCLSGGSEEMPFTIDEKGEQIFPMKNFLYEIR